MKTKAQLITAAKAHAEAAVTIEEAAQKENRKITPEERRQMQVHLAEGRLLMKQIREMDPEAAKRRQKEADEELTNQILALTGDAPKDYQREYNRKRGLTGQRPGPASVWGQDFMKALPYQPRTGQKDLLPPSGSVTASPLSDTIGRLDDEGKVDTVLQLIPIKPTTGDAFSYLRETVREHAAAPVAIGQKKPTSTYTLERVDDQIRTIAHLTEPIPRNWLLDAPALQQYLDSTLRAGVLYELEYQIFQGAGTGEDLPGILMSAGVLVQSWDTDILTTCRKAVTALELRPINPTAFCFNPTDWETIELTTASGSGEYLIDGSPVDRSRRRLWGLPVALSLGVPEGTGIVADWGTALELLEREETKIEWSDGFYHGATAYDEDGYTGFESNEVMWRGEGRWGMEFFRPTAVCEIDLSEGS